jgi:hypothetical protein
LALTLAAPSYGVSVRLRVEGLASTLFDGPVETVPHAVMGHTCDGTNGGANPTPGPTMTGALDSAGLPWDGTWFASFEDFSVDRIGPDAADLVNNRFWGLVLNGSQTSVGGCQQQVKVGDEVLFAYDLFSKAHILKLTASSLIVPVGQPVTFTVVDQQNGSPVAGASVGSATTGAAGTASASFPVPTSVTFKAEKADSVRSAPVTVCVFEPSAGGCGLAAQPSATPPTTVPPGESTAPESPQPTGGTAPAAGSEPACYAVSVSGTRLRVGEKTRLRISIRAQGAPIAHAIIQIRGDGILLRRSTDIHGAAHVRVLPQGPGALRIGVRGQIKRCGEERLPVRGST